MVSSEEDSRNKHHPCGSVCDMSVYRRYRQGMSKVKRYTQGVDGFQLYWSIQHRCRPSQSTGLALLCFVLDSNYSSLLRSRLKKETSDMLCVLSYM